MALNSATIIYKVSKSGAPNSYQGLAVNIPAKYKGQWISIEAMVKGSGSGKPTVCFWESGGLGAINLPLHSSTDWHKAQVRVLYDESLTSLDIVFHPGYSNADGSFHIDNIKRMAEFDPD